MWPEKKRHFYYNSLEENIRGFCNAFQSKRTTLSVLLKRCNAEFLKVGYSEIWHDKYFIWEILNGIQEVIGLNTLYRIQSPYIFAPRISYILNILACTRRKIQVITPLTETLPYNAKHIPKALTWIKICLSTQLRTAYTTCSQLNLNILNCGFSLPCKSKSYLGVNQNSLEALLTQ